jgi:hypothetical protein
MHSDIETLGREWATAELRADVSALGSMLTDDFIGIGPLGFMLTKQEWLDRHQSGDLIYDAVDLDQVTVRVYDGAAILTARNGSSSRSRCREAVALRDRPAVHLLPSPRSARRLHVGD